MIFFDEDEARNERMKEEWHERQYVKMGGL